MGQSIKKLNDLQDPLGFDLFLSVALFEETITSLACLYFQLWLREQHKPAAIRDQDLARMCRQRHRQLNFIRHSFKIGQIDERNQATEVYSEELKEIRLLYFSM